MLGEHAVVPLPKRFDELRRVVDVKRTVTVPLGNWFIGIGIFTRRPPGKESALAPGANYVGQQNRDHSGTVGKLRYGPARVPSRKSPAEAIKILKDRKYTACEIDFESGFWMDYPWAEEFGKLARKG